jgi:hypothetical protein
VRLDGVLINKESPVTDEYIPEPYSDCADLEPNLDPDIEVVEAELIEDEPAVTSYGERILEEVAPIACPFWQSTEPKSLVARLGRADLAP